MQHLRVCVLLALCILVTNATKRVVVIRDIIDSRAKQQDPQQNFQFDTLQNTQHLFQECLIQHDNKTEDGWAFIEAPLQPQLQRDTQVWTGYLGYVHTSEIATFDESIIKPDANGCPTYDIIVHELVTNVYSRNCAQVGCDESDLVTVASIGTRFVVAGMPVAELGWYRVFLLGFLANNGTKTGYVHASDVSLISHLSQKPNHLLAHQASKMLGWKYFWGGRSSYRMKRLGDVGKLSGVDCSGLTGLVYNTIAGMIIPRDAHDQFMKSNNVTDPSKIQIGDLFFFHHIDGERITHVMMYIGNLNIAESTAFSNSTRIISIHDRYCVNSLEELRWDMIVCEGQEGKQQMRIRWGRYLKTLNEESDIDKTLLYTLIALCAVFVVGSGIVAVSLLLRKCYVSRYKSVEERERLAHVNTAYGRMTEE